MWFSYVSGKRLDSYAKEVDMEKELRACTVFFMRVYVCRLISRAWEIASTRYEDPKLAKMTASKIFSAGNAEIPVEYFSCRTSQGNPF
jgi:hypothetical protein